MDYIQKIENDRLKQIMEQNISYLDNIAEQMKLGYVSVFAGAGLSIESGYVDWKRLLAPLCKQMRLDANVDLTELAQYYKNQYGRQGLNDVVFNEFAKIPQSNKNVSWLARLPIKEYWTTNYDDVLERTIGEQGRVVETIINQESFKYHDPKRDVVVYKMHGDKRYPDDVVLTREDYQRYDDNRQLFTKLLSVELVSRTFLFIGFSFNDPNLERILSIAKSSLNSRTLPRHYCFMRKVQITDYGTDEEIQTSDAFEKFIQANNYQKLRIKDMANYGIYTILIDNFEQITGMLKYLYNKHIADNVFVSGGIDPGGKEGYGGFNRSQKEQTGLSRAEHFLTDLGKALVDNGFRIYTAFGAGVGNYILSGVINSQENGLHNSDVAGRKIHISSLIGMEEEERKTIRKRLIGQCSSTIFLFGRVKDDENGKKSGIWQEYEIAEECGNFMIPVRETGLSAERIFEKLAQKEKLPDSLSFLKDNHEKEEELVEGIIGALKEYREKEGKRLKDELFSDIGIDSTGVFISYHYDIDSGTAKEITQIVNEDENSHYMVVREEQKKNDDESIRQWIDKMLKKTRITVLLLSRQTLEREYVSYELKESLSQGHLLLPILIDSQENDFSEEDEKFFLCRLREAAKNENLEMKKWYREEGEKNIVRWLDEMSAYKNCFGGNCVRGMLQ